MAVIAPETNDTSEVMISIEMTRRKSRVRLIQMGYGVNESAGETAKKNDANKNLIKRFNFHSTMILKSTMGVETTSDAPVADDEENIAKKVRRERQLIVLEVCLVSSNPMRIWTNSGRRNQKRLKR